MSSRLSLFLSAISERGSHHYACKVYKEMASKNNQCSKYRTGSSAENPPRCRPVSSPQVFLAVGQILQRDGGKIIL